MYSNAYIFRYAGIMVIVAAAVLSTAAMLLQPFQEKNMAIEKMGEIMASAKIGDVKTSETISRFNEVVVESLVVDQDGNVVESVTEGHMEEAKAFSIVLKDQLYNKANNQPYELPIYVIKTNGKKVYVLPLLGNGLWGNLYGNFALEEDFNTIYGVTFSHDKETPGLGAEIAEQPFKDQFVGKKIFDEQGNFTSIKVVKGGAATMPESQQIHGVDAISGGTITSVGVDEMIKNVLEAYLPYIKKHSV
ncbi:MAG: NADH:ubiquinone reductase (Na(+)-transporting) subunit C [bacterium]|jgi:Na+-transporting NADH:ubiquinone oxidoreductase subunit C